MEINQIDLVTNEVKNLSPNADIRMDTTSSLHMASSCQMGYKGEGPSTSVVDTRLRVKGSIQNVRVIDASVMPSVTRGNTNAPTLMIAERGSRMIIEENARKFD